MSNRVRGRITPAVTALAVDSLIIGLGLLAALTTAAVSAFAVQGSPTMTHRSANNTANWCFARSHPQPEKAQPGPRPITVKTHTNDAG